MRIKLSNLTLILTLGSTLCAFKVGEQIELQNYVHARTDPNFLKYYKKNIETVLPIGTTGEISEVKEFKSGNAGLKIKVTVGPKAGEYWVYYNKKSPTMKIIEPKTLKEFKLDEVKFEKLTDINSEILKPLDNLSAKMFEPTPALRSPEEMALKGVAGEVNEVGAALQEALKKTLTDCPPKEDEIIVETKPKITPEITLTAANVSEDSNNSLSSNSIQEKDYNVSNDAFPYRETPETKFASYDYRTSPDNDNFQLITNGGYKSNGKVVGFQILNNKPNAIIPKDSARIRTFDFVSDDLARSDMKLLIRDANGEATYQDIDTAIVFLPRTKLPSIKQVGNELLVTLPNGEKVTYNAETKEIISGVLTETKLAVNGNGVTRSGVEYKGAGVIIRADQVKVPALEDVEAGNSYTRSKTIATISKKGFPDCKVPVKEIWHRDPQVPDINHVVMKPEFQSDVGLNSFIKKKCGFSIF